MLSRTPTSKKPRYMYLHPPSTTIRPRSLGRTSRTSCVYLNVNSDSSVDVADIANVIDVMAKSSNDPVADVNQDGVVDVADIATIIDKMAGK